MWSVDHLPDQLLPRALTCVGHVQGQRFGYQPVNGCCCWTPAAHDASPRTEYHGHSVHAMHASCVLAFFWHVIFATLYCQ
jgi:hypothetical protein